jgi:uncharacterized protein
MRSDYVGSELEFLWHAGEPLIAGKAFYERVLDSINQHNIHHINVKNSIQTNGVLIDKEWADLFFENQFSVGVSIDGPSFIHDVNRHTRTGQPTHSKVMDGLCHLRSSGISPGVLAVLTESSLGHAEDIYEFFFQNELYSIGFNVEEIENNHSESTMKLGGSVRSDKRLLDKYRDFISTFYDLCRRDGNLVNVREFNAVYQVLLQRQNDRAYHIRPLEVRSRGIITIDKRGNVIPFAPEFAGNKSQEYGDFMVGSLSSTGLDDILLGEKMNRLDNEVQKSVALCQSECDYFSYCGGAFLSNKFSENRTLESTETSACRLHMKTMCDVVFEKLLHRYSI